MHETQASPAGQQDWPGMPDDFSSVRKKPLADLFQVNWLLFLRSQGRPSPL